MKTKWWQLHKRNQELWDLGVYWKKRCMDAEEILYIQKELNETLIKKLIKEAGKDEPK